MSKSLAQMQDAVGSARIVPVRKCSEVHCAVTDALTQTLACLLAKLAVNHKPAETCLAKEGLLGALGQDLVCLATVP